MKLNAMKWTYGLVCAVGIFVYCTALAVAGETIGAETPAHRLKPVTVTAGGLSPRVDLDPADRKSVV